MAGSHGVWCHFWWISFAAWPCNWGPSHWELQHSSSETWCNSVQGYITILMGALTKPHWNLPHRLSSLPCSNLLCGERIPHALLSKLISSPASTFYSTFLFPTGSKNGWLKLKLCWKQRKNSWLKAEFRTVHISPRKNRDKACTAQTHQFRLHLNISYLIRLLWHVRTLQMWKHHKVSESIDLKHLSLKAAHFESQVFKD